MLYNAILFKNNVLLSFAPSLIFFPAESQIESSFGKDYIYKACP